MTLYALVYLTLSMFAYLDAQPDHVTKAGFGVTLVLTLGGFRPRFQPCFLFATISFPVAHHGARLYNLLCSQ